MQRLSGIPSTSAAEQPSARDGWLGQLTVCAAANNNGVGGHDSGIATPRSYPLAGGSKGMGRCAAQMLAADGCNVASARTQANIHNAVVSIESAGETAIGISADLKRHNDI